MRKHLNAHHGINDGGKGDTDKAVITKSNISFLPFKQCLCTPTRCLSYAVSDRIYLYLNIFDNLVFFL